MAYARHTRVVHCRQCCHIKLLVYDKLYSGVDYGHVTIHSVIANSKVVWQNGHHTRVAAVLSAIVTVNCCKESPTLAVINVHDTRDDANASYHVRRKTQKSAWPECPARLRADRYPYFLGPVKPRSKNQLQAVSRFDTVHLFIYCMLPFRCINNY